MSSNRRSTDLKEPITKIKVDQYYVVIGVEANNENAYREDKITFSNKIAKHQYLSGPNLDWGHAFFYVVHNEKVICFFSFGPSAGKKLGENKIIGNASTCQYSIGEVTQMYVLKIDEDSAHKIKKDVEQMYLKSNNQMYDEESESWVTYSSNEKKYRAITNETCAKEAYNILLKYLGNKIPNAFGYIKTYGISKNAICPYAWNESLNSSKLNHYIYPEYPKIGKAKDLLAAYSKINDDGKQEKIYTYYLRTEESNAYFMEMIPPFTAGDDKDWYLVEDEIDPLKINKYF